LIDRDRIFSITDRDVGASASLLDATPEPTVLPGSAPRGNAVREIGRYGNDPTIRVRRNIPQIAGFPAAIARAGMVMESGTDKKTRCEYRCQLVPLLYIPTSDVSWMHQPPDGRKAISDAAKPRANAWRR
jgi:hypothetical protein